MSYNRSRLVISSLTSGKGTNRNQNVWSMWIETTLICKTGTRDPWIKDSQWSHGNMGNFASDYLGLTITNTRPSSSSPDKPNPLSSFLDEENLKNQNMDFIHTNCTQKNLLIVACSLSGSLFRAFCRTNLKQQNMRRHKNTQQGATYSCKNVTCSASFFFPADRRSWM